MRSCFLGKARLREQKMYIVPWESPWHDKGRGSWQYHQTALILGLCENRGSGRSRRRNHDEDFISAGTEWKTVLQHYATQANPLCNSRKTQFRSKTRCPFLCTGLFSLPEFCCCPLPPHLHFHQPFGSQVQALIQIPTVLLAHHWPMHVDVPMYVTLLRQVCVCSPIN